MEKNVMRSYEMVGRERKEVARQLSVWGEDCDEDVSDITDKLGVLVYEIGELEDGFIDRYDQYRLTMKSIRNIEASVQPSRDRKQKIMDTIYMMKHKEPQNPKLVVLEQELVRAEAESLVAEAQLSNITREKLKSAFTLQFDALKEHAEKLALIAGYGKHLLELLDDSAVTPGETRPAYDGYEDSKQIIVDCENALMDWTHAGASIKPSLSTRRRNRQSNRSLNDGEWVNADEHEEQGEILNDVELGQPIEHSEREGEVVAV